MVTPAHWISEPGLYQFALRADDGARLSIDGQLIDDDDPRHDYGTLGITVPNWRTPKFATLKLCAGVHSLELIYFHSSPFRPKLTFEIANPGRKFRAFRVRDFSPPLGARMAACGN